MHLYLRKIVTCDRQKQNHAGVAGVAAWVSVDIFEVRTWNDLRHSLWSLLRLASWCRSLLMRVVCSGMSSMTWFELIVTLHSEPSLRAKEDRLATWLCCATMTRMPIDDYILEAWTVTFARRFSHTPSASPSQSFGAMDSERTRCSEHGRTMQDTLFALQCFVSQAKMAGIILGFVLLRLQEAAETVLPSQALNVFICQPYAYNQHQSTAIRINPDILSYP